MPTIQSVTGGQGVYATGPAAIWYQRDEFTRDGFMGHAWLMKVGKVPTKETLDRTHVCLGALNTREPGEAWQAMQADFWSPQGEAREFIRALGLGHTSMHIGDVVMIEGVYYMVDGIGFVQLE